MKPSDGIRGKRVYIITKDGDNFRVGHNIEEKILRPEEFKQFYDKDLSGKRYLLQKYITSRTAQGDPFDCRIHVEKNGEGKWVNARNYIRMIISRVEVRRYAIGVHRFTTLGPLHYFNDSQLRSTYSHKEST